MALRIIKVTCLRVHIYRGMQTCRKGDELPKLCFIKKRGKKKIPHQLE
jgi:hypothetical protein